MKSLIINIALASAILLCRSNKSWSQDRPRIWYGHSVQTRFNKEWRLSAGQLFMFSGDPRSLKTIQNAINATYRYNSRIRFGFGFQKSFSTKSTTQKSRNRLTGRISVAGNIDRIRITNNFRAEWHFPERSKYEFRLRYAFRLHIRNLDLPLRARPFITNEFHYYLAGRPLWYRDNKGDKVVRQSTDGLHAHRITLGLRFTPFKRTNVSIRYMRQTEFNIGSEYRRINTVDPRDGKVRRAFNNFSTFIFTVNYRLKRIKIG